ncbi:MAG: hypothetical protein KAG97_00605 [Victivallales bacterium]|nr:hypothetical protein [Victivallales bacterium]
MFDTKIDLRRLKEEIDGLEKGLREHPLEPGGILFYGSSTIGNWRADDLCYKQMTPLPVVNTGFGGSTAEEALYYYHKLVVPVKPSIILYYEGANDLSNGYAPADILELSHRLFEWARQDFPGIRFVIMPIKLCPGLRDIHDEAVICNKLFEKYAENNDDTRFLDMYPLLYDAGGEFRTDIYVEDKLHHNLKGYEELTALVKPVLEKLYSTVPPNKK